MALQAGDGGREPGLCRRGTSRLYDEPVLYGDVATDADPVDAGGGTAGEDIGVELEEPVVERLDPVGLRDTTFLRRSALLLRLRG